MDKSHIFIVRVRAGQQPEHACHVTVRKIEAEAATTVPTADELWTSMLSALKAADSRDAADGSPAAAAIAPLSDRPEVELLSGPFGVGGSPLHAVGEGDVPLISGATYASATTAVGPLSR